MHIVRIKSSPFHETHFHGILGKADENERLILGRDGL